MGSTIVGMSMGTIFTLVWAGLAVIFLAVEIYAFMQARKFKDEGEDGGRGTFSWQIWWLRRYWYTRLLAVVVWGWAFYHFFIENGAATRNWWDDLLVLVALGVISFLVKPRSVDG